MAVVIDILGHFANFDTEPRLLQWWILGAARGICPLCYSVTGLTPPVGNAASCFYELTFDILMVEPHGPFSFDF